MQILTSYLKRNNFIRDNKITKANMIKVEGFYLHYILINVRKITQVFGKLDFFWVTSFLYSAKKNQRSIIWNSSFFDLFLLSRNLKYLFIKKKTLVLASFEYFKRCLSSKQHVVDNTQLFFLSSDNNITVLENRIQHLRLFS